MAASLTPALSQRARGRWSALRATFLVMKAVCGRDTHLHVRLIRPAGTALQMTAEQPSHLGRQQVVRAGAPRYRDHLTVEVFMALLAVALAHVRDEGGGRHGRVREIQGVP